MGGRPLRNSRILIGALIIVAAITYLAITGFTKSTAYYVEVDGYLSKASALASQVVRVAGTVKTGSIKWEPGSVWLKFTLAGQTGELPVVFKGIRPDNFEDGRTVVVEGKPGADGVFAAKKLIIQCPSKYEAAPKGQ